MKHLILLAVIAAIFVPAALSSEEQENLDFTIGQLEKRHAIQRMEMEMQQQRSEMEFENQMREIELQKCRMELENRGNKASYHHRKHHRGCGLFILICLIVHILTAVWVYQDIRDRKEGSGIWIIAAILTGLFGTLVYAVIRIGDAKKSA